ncbi:thioester reductase domain-containing protein [Streptomyces sp. URMC 129]|uniref:thioester reductase domain-containing protein n=1 Tax=Streptomyces sp. URMC 129 TaxID=3423407 RepID=UPI003F19ACA0
MTMSGQSIQPDYRKHLVTALRTIERLEQRLSSSRDAWLDEPIAIVGLGCRFPGGANTPESFWDLLRNGVDATAEFPADRADALPFYDPDPETPGKAYTIRGGFIDRVDRFEPEVFGISPREALGMDPQHRITLEVVWEALERAGYAPDALDGSRTGVYLGLSTTDYVRLRQQLGDINDIDAYQLVGEPSFLAGRVSYTLGLRGPSQVIDTACSSSLVALHEACQALRLRHCDMALAGGVNLILAPYGFVLMSKFQALSPDGRCKTFSAGADGYARGEGAAVVVLRRLSDAVEAGDNVLAVVRGTAVNHDGRSSGLTVPNPAAQQDMLRGALAQAGIQPRDVDYVEAHGTGTSLGDPIELRALDAVLGSGRAPDAPLLVGAVKTNIGHLEPAAGVAGLVKLVLALQHGEIPPSLHFDRPNPNVAWDRLNVEVTGARRAWPERGRARIGGVSSFGVSGTNAHAVVTSPPDRTASPGNHRRQGLLLASARTEPALRELAERYARHLRREPGLSLGDVCFTTHVGRARQTTGLAAVGASVDELADALDAYAQGRATPALTTGTLPPYKHRKVAWLFTGQGAQYAGMARGLAAEPAFAEAFEEATQAIDPYLDRPLRDVVWPAAGQDTPLDTTRYTQPALFALEYALARALLSWGTRPAAVAGHSVGEIAAACVAGVFTLADAARLVTARARLMSELPAGGVMVALRCDEATARAAIAPYPRTVTVAAVNAPDEVVISGAERDVDAALAALEARGVKGRRLTVSHAFHSPLLDPMVDRFREELAGISYAAPKIPLMSNLTGAAWTDAEVGPEYWVRHALGAVRFADTVARLHADGFRTFCEIGPAPVLTALGGRCLGDRATFVPTLRRGGDDLQRLLQAVGTLRLRGAGVDWEAFHRDETVRRVPLPTTPWHGDSYWFEEAAPAAPATQASTVPAPPAAGAVDSLTRPLPGIRRRLASAVATYELEPADGHWTAHARKDGEGRHVLPFGGLAATAVAAAEDCLGGRFSCVAEADVVESLPLPDTGDRTAQLVVTEGKDGEARCEYRSTSGPEEAAGAPWRLHARFVLRRKPATAKLTEALRTPPPFEPGAYDRLLEPRTDALSPALAGTVGDVRRGEGGVVVDLDGTGGWAEVLDAVVAATSWAADAERPDAQRPDGAAGLGAVRQVRGLFCAAPGSVRRVRAGGGRTSSGELRGTVDFFDADGTYLGGADQIRLAAGGEGPAPAPWRDVSELRYDTTWQLVPDDGTAGPGPAGEGFLLLADRSGFADRLATALRARGAQVMTAQPPVSGVAGDCVPRPEDVREIVTAWCAETDRPGRILVLTGLDAPHLDHTDAWGLEEYAARADLLTAALVKELAGRDDCPDARLTLVTRGAMPAGPDPEVRAAVAHTLWGLGRVIALEHPERWGGAVDLDPDDDPAAAERLIAALGRTGAEDEQALRGAEVYAARLVPRPAEPAEQRLTPAVRADGTYLITGAFGGIGQTLATWLARLGAGRLVLLGRTPLPPRATWNKRLPAPVRARVRAVRELERLGAEVTVIAADVADEAAMLSLFRDLEEHPLPLRGVIHAAGVSLPQFLRDVDADSYRKVWRPKVIGGWLLHHLSHGDDLEFFLGFSSIAATWGSQHLASYAAGNAFLDGLAHQRRSEGLPALTVAWGPWELASNLFDEEVMAFLTSTGLRPLSAEQCVHLLGGLLASGRTHQVVCAADWTVYKPVMEARIPRPMLRTIELSEDTDARDGEADPLVETLKGEDAAARRRRLAGFLREAVAEVAGVQAAGIDADADVMGYGLDSLMVMDIVRRCKRGLRLSVQASQLFERTTLADWAELVDDTFRREHLGGDGEAAPAGQDGDPTDPAWLRGDVTLDPAIQPPAGRTTPLDRARHVLLTGATGFLGAYLLDELLARTDATVHCLVRCPDPAGGLARIRANFERYLTWPAGADQRIAVVPGDLEKPLLGLEEKKFDELGELLDVIFHNGAWVNFSYTYEQLRPANLGGTGEILRLACRRRPTPVHHVSTYGIWGIPADGRTVLRESDDISEAGRLVTGYVQTKWAAERLVELGRERGIPIDLYRPGRVLGDSRTGAALTTHFTIRVIKGSIQLGMVPDLDLEVEMTPIDYVTSALVAIAAGKTSHGTTYHLVNRHKMRFSQLAETLARRWPVRVVPVDEWWQALRAGYGDGENDLHPVMDVVEAFVVGGEEAIDYDDKNAEAALAATGIACPPLDQRLLDLYLGWLTRTGYLPEPGHPRT